MERGVYFDGWYRGRHCYHPSLPARRLAMVEDLERYRATVLVWSALGGGSVSLPYLEHEADGEVALRDRMYGGLNDREFVAECGRRGITVFGVVFEAQGWEFPAELDAAEEHVLALNELRGVGVPGWLGLREFSQDRYPKLWPSFRDYFPDGLTNSAGEPVTDLVAECVSRTVDGRPHHSRWVEVPGMTHECFYMDRNNPVWREYLKAVIRIQVDAGVHGVQLDEAATPLNALQYGGCFCRDCTEGFRQHLLGLPDARRPAELAGTDLAGFDYPAYLLDRGVDPAVSGASTPLIGEYFTFQRIAVTQTFVELADYARGYAASRGRSVLVTGNLYNVFPHYNGIIEHVDLVVTEMRNVGYRQPEWFRYVVGMARGKSVVVVENPYGGVVPDLLARLDQGRGADLARLLAYEAAAMGANMTLPYGAWMGSAIPDAFSLPDPLAVEIQTFLAVVDPQLSVRSANDVVVLYDVGSNAASSLERHIFADNRVNDVDESVPVPFWHVSEQLGRAGVAFDVLAVDDGVVPAWRLAAADLERYALVVVPDPVTLPGWATAELDRYRAGGGRVLRSDGDELLGPTRAVSHVTVSGSDPVGLNTHALTDGGEAVHLVNYGFDADGVVRRTGPLTLHLRGVDVRAVECLFPDAPALTLPARRGLDGAVEVVLPGLGVYAVVHWGPAVVGATAQID